MRLTCALLKKLSDRLGSLSNFTSQPVAQAIIHFMRSNDPSESLRQLPGGGMCVLMCLFAYGFAVDVRVHLLVRVCFCCRCACSSACSRMFLL